MGDLEFVHKCVNGDKQAWDEFVDKYSRLIYNYIHSIFKSKGFSPPLQGNVSELFQDVFLLLVKDNFRKLRSFKAKNGCSLASWLRQVVINLAIDYTRRLRPIVSLDEEINEEFSLQDVLADDALPADSLLEAEDMVTHLKDCIAGLGTQEKYFLELHINRGMALEELKDIFKVSRGAIDMRKSRIIDRLRDCFKKKGLILSR